MYSIELATLADAVPEAEVEGNFCNMESDFNQAADHTGTSVAVSMVI